MKKLKETHVPFVRNSLLKLDYSPSHMTISNKICSYGSIETGEKPERSNDFNFILNTFVYLVVHHPGTVEEIMRLLNNKTVADFEIHKKTIIRNF